jgi:hypothetical protein
MGWACSTNGKKKKTYRILEEDQDVGVWIILKRITERQDEVVRTRLIWLRIGTSGGLLLTLNFGVP